MSLNIDFRNKMHPSAGDIPSLERESREEAADERWKKITDRVVANGDCVFFTNSRLLESFSGKLEERVKSWLLEESKGSSIRKALFETNLNTRITPIVRSFRSERDSTILNRTEIVESKGLSIRHEFTSETGEGVSFDHFDFEELELSSLNEPLQESLSFVFSVSAAIYESSNAESLSSRSWVVIK